MAHARVAELEAELARERAALADERAENERLRDAYHRLRIELELMRRRLFVAKAERIDTTQLEMEFGHKLAELDELNRKLGLDRAGDDAGPGTDPSGDDKPQGSGTGRRRSNHRSTGRRNLQAEDLPVERIEIADPDLAGHAGQIAWEESSQVTWRRGGYVRVVIARAKHKPAVTVGTVVADQPVSTLAPGPTSESIIDGMSAIVTAPMPPVILPRSIAAAGLIAHIVTDKFCYGLPLYRQEERSAHLGFRINRGSMSRWIEEVGMTTGATVVHAMREEALRSAFCIATDATGILVQPIRDGNNQPRRGCTRGHFFVQIADADHVFFEYTPRETSAAVSELFRGFPG